MTACFLQKPKPYQDITTIHLMGAFSHRADGIVQIHLFTSEEEIITSLQNRFNRGGMGYIEWSLLLNSFRSCLQTVIQKSSCFQLSFENGHQSMAIQVQTEADLEAALVQFQLPIPRATLVVVGGASGLTTDYLERLRSLFQEVLCPLAEQFGLAVVDGGTDVGVMQLMGQARLASQSTFPLIGVVVQRKAILPENTATVDQDAARLETHHTHFLLVPGEEWGDESHWIGYVAAHLTGETKPSVTVLVNGGTIALNQDVPNSLEHGRPVLVIAGSGLAADQLAAAIRGKTDDPDIRSLVESNLLSVVDLTAGVETIRLKLQNLLLEASPS